MDRDLESLTRATTRGFAATVVLLRDGELGVEVLLAERPRDGGSFAGAWVFPGGVVEPGDLDGDEPSSEAVARRTAARETEEEVGLVVEPDALVPFSRWTPPAGSPKHLVTTFFAARAPGGELRPAAAEVAEVEWLRPSDALDRHAAGALTLWPPTFVTLHGLQHAASVDEALDELRGGEVRPYVSRFTSHERTTLLWQEDAAFDPEAEHADHPAVPDEAPDAHGNRHRLMMDRLPWVYLNQF
ncbi:NUDIX domain-containing protein [Agromyces sp. CFH 90414]|uniref:NUDIX domain-containing protein n=1 Tax=Agromyces agglutinans TaxID=2662258 RepID=A0A6I2FET4_9MICO|nr:NUDIX domain-containing protein [Agromyces agglutinans]MRG61210.1 NUDIX domain-containing protein [Agromyces agglutinans]